MPTSVRGSVSSGRTRSVMRWSSLPNCRVATLAAVEATRLNGRSA